MSVKPGFDRKTAKKFAVVHRPHDDPRYHDPEASEHVLVPMKEAKKQRNPEKSKSPFARNGAGTGPGPRLGPGHEHIGEAALYGIGFDDSKYDYTQHLKPVGMDPQNAVLISANSANKQESRKLKAEDLFAQLEIQESSEKKNDSMFERGGTAKREYLKHQQDMDDELRGFKPDMNPALREVLEALEDEAYVVNKDIVVGNKAKQGSKRSQESDADDILDGDEDDDDLFEQLLTSGQADGAEDFEQEFDEWDVENLENYEDEHYRDEMQQFEKIENFEDLQNIDYQADVTRFKQQQSRKAHDEDWESVQDFNSEADDLESISVPPQEGSAEVQEEEDTLGDLPSISAGVKSSTKQKKKGRDRRKKGAMSDVSGFSMSSSAIARSEALTVLDDRYDQVISGYENYEEEGAEAEEEYQPFDMANERADLESMLDDFLDNYELESGGRKLVKKNYEAARFQKAADEVSKGKLSQRRNKQRNSEGGVGSITGSLNSLRF
ncbi:LANO_0H09252g1_1 [Lachancea nothofagi CBS 11611]|uniref:LANO_0H09252g1_1 n=1 Tax=Lachancea nothofagi CBS 11611 TaxID=1266666 RepID=A0A1G4KM61_9SACH|nr:LANO_0H09252g1_1 [Lachancea nothofagi CBS 11611]